MSCCGSHIILPVEAWEDSGTEQIRAGAEVWSDARAEEEIGITNPSLLTVTLSKSGNIFASQLLHL